MHYHCLNDRVVKNPPPVGASIARPLLAGGAIRIGASNSRFYRRPTVNIGSVLYFTRALFPCRCGILYKRFCASPTGGSGNNLFCTRVLFHIAANSYRRTSDARPYDLYFLWLCHLENGNLPNSSAEHNRVIAKTASAILNADWPCAEHRQPPDAKTYGRTAVKVMLLPSAVLAFMLPPWASAAALAMDSPTPVPPPEPERDLSAR